VLSRREWLMAASAARGRFQGEPETGWNLAFRFDASRVMVFEREAALPIPADARLLEHVPPGGIFDNVQFSQAEPVPPEPYQVLSGRQGLLRAAAGDRIYFEDCRRHDGLRLSLDSRDASRLAVVEGNVFLARRAVRGPLLWNVARAPRPAHLNVNEHNRVEMLLEQEMRTAVRGAPVPHADKLLKGRADREVAVQELITEHRLRLLLARAVWRVDHNPVYLVGATIRLQEPWTTDSIDVRWIEGETHDRSVALAALPVALEAFSVDDRLHVVVHYQEKNKQVFELWRRDAGRWQPARARLVVGC